MVLAVVAAIVPGWLVHAEWWIPLAGLHALWISQVGLRSKPEETLGMMSGLIAALPVSFDEIASLRARVWFRQAISCLGPLAAFGWLVAWRQGVSPLDGLLQVATTFLLYGAGVLLGTCLQVSLGTNDSARLGMLLLWSIGRGRSA